MFHVKQYLERTRVLTTRGGDDADTDRKEVIDVHTQAVPQIIVLSCNDKGYKKWKKKIYKKKKRKTLALKTCKNVNTKITRRHF